MYNYLNEVAFEEHCSFRRACEISFQVAIGTADLYTDWHWLINDIVTNVVYIDFGFSHRISLHIRVFYRTFISAYILTKLMWMLLVRHVFPHKMLVYTSYRQHEKPQLVIVETCVISGFPQLCIRQCYVDQAV